MTTCLGKSCSFGLPRVPLVNCCHFMYIAILPFGFEGRMWDLTVSVPGPCLSFYFEYVLFYQFCAEITAFFDQEKFGTAPHYDVETFGRNLRQNVKMT